MIDIISVFIYFFAVIDPIGTVPVFIAVTSRFDAADRRKIALSATITAGAILVFFVIAGEIILNAMQIPLSAFQVAGGIVLFLFALTMIFGESKPDEEVRLASADNNPSVYPLAVPSIASPGAMLAAVLLTENTLYTLGQQVTVTVTMLAVLLIALLLMLASIWVHRFIGDNGASIISRVMGMILASVAASSVLEGLKTYFAL